MKMPKNPYLLTMDGQIVDFFRTLEDALITAHRINTNRIRSSGDNSKRQSIKVTYDTPLETRVVHEE
jgi:hypothetical protein